VNHQATTATFDVLRDLGFHPDDTVIYSDVKPGLSIDFGNFKLSASCLLNLRFVEVVLFTGILATPHSLAEIEFELPRRVLSREQCAAWIVWSLDQSAPDRRFQPTRYVGWIEEGRQNQRLLPWVAELGEYKSRPSCTVRRDWLRLALKTLSEHLSSLPDSTAVVFSFDGSVLTIRIDGKVVAMPGEGFPWAVRFNINAGRLRRFPRRFMHEYIGVEIWESRLRIYGWAYEGTIDVSGLAGRAEIQ
jgi:hypothetical protein